MAALTHGPGDRLVFCNQRRVQRGLRDRSASPRGLSLLRPGVAISTISVQGPVSAWTCRAHRYRQPGQGHGRARRWMLRVSPVSNLVMRPAALQCDCFSLLYIPCRTVKPGFHESAASARDMRSVSRLISAGCTPSTGKTITPVSATIPAIRSVSSKTRA